MYQVLHTGICRAHLLNVPVLKCLFDVLELDGVAELKENVEMFGYLSVGRLVAVMTDQSVLCALIAVSESCRQLFDILQAVFDQSVFGAIFR